MDSGITPLTVDQTETQQQQSKKNSYIHRVLVAFDILVNVICNGHEDETISSRAARAATEGKLWGKILSNFLDLFQSDHGAKAIAADAYRAEQVSYLEDTSGDINK